MQVSRVNLQNTVGNISKKVTTSPIASTKNIGVLGIGAAAVSGMYLAKKSNEEYSKFKALGFNNQEIRQALKAKNRIDGKPVFDKQGIDILFETSKINDSTFFNCVKQNLENIDKLKRLGDEHNKNITYEMHAKTPDGEIIASMDVSKETTNIYVSTRKGLDRELYSKEILKDLTVESFEKKEKTKTVSLEKVIYDRDRNLIIRRQIDPEDKKTVKSYTQLTMSQEGNMTDSISVVYDNDGKGIATSNDYKNNSVIKAVIGNSQNKMYAQEKTYINNVTGKAETLKMEQSELTGVYNSKIIDDKGNEKTESKVTKDEYGNTIVEKHFESLDGTKTEYNNITSKDGNNIKMSYIITSKDGKTLANIERTFERVNDKLAYSSVNGHKYTIEKTADGYCVTDHKSDEKTNIKLSDICLNEESIKNSDIFDKMSGDMILDFYNRGYKFNYIEENRKSTIQPVTKELNAKDDLFIFNHELGHVKDFITSDDADYDNTKKSNIKQKRITPQIQKTYNEELKAFFANSSDIERGYVSYLTDKLSFIEKDGHISEAVAETNALLSTAPGADYDGNLARDYYFQKYFPRTIAELSKILIK